MKEFWHITLAFSMMKPIFVILCISNDKKLMKLLILLSDEENKQQKSRHQLMLMKAAPNYKTSGVSA
jgi:hypothetical protein